MGKPPRPSNAVSTRPPAQLPRCAGRHTAVIRCHCWHSTRRVVESQRQKPIHGRTQFITPFPPREPRYRIMHVNRKPKSLWREVLRLDEADAARRDSKLRPSQSPLGHWPAFLPCVRAMMDGPSSPGASWCLEGCLDWEHIEYLRTAHLCTWTNDGLDLSGPGQHGPSPLPRPCVPFCCTERPCPSLRACAFKQARTATASADEIDTPS